MPRVGDFKSFLLSLGSRFGLLRHWGWSAMPRRQPSSGEPKKFPHPDAPNPWDPTGPPLCGGRLRHPSQRLSHRRNFRAVGASSAGPLSEEVVCRGVEPGGAVAPSRWVQHAGAGGRRWSSKRGRLFFSTPPFPPSFPPLPPPPALLPNPGWGPSGTTLPPVRSWPRSPPSSSSSSSLP